MGINNTAFQISAGNTVFSEIQCSIAEKGDQSSQEVTIYVIKNLKRGV